MNALFEKKRIVADFSKIRMVLLERDENQGQLRFFRVVIENKCVNVAEILLGVP